MYKDKPLLHRRQKAHRPGMLRTVAFDVTSRCNMTCSHCYAETFNKVDMVELSDLKRVFDEFYDLGVYHYVFQGGEPTIARDRLEAILGFCHPDETYINVVSNAWNMSPDMIAWLKERKVDKLTFSMDSGIPEEHDANRLPGSFVKVLKAIDDVLAAGLFCSVSTVVTHANLHSEGFRRIVDIALEKDIRVDIQIAEPVGKWDGNTDLLITPEDAAHLKELRNSLGRMANGQTRLNRDVYTLDEDGDRCPAGSEFMSVSANGNLLPCNFLQFSLGNVRDRSIREMREAALKSHWFQGSCDCCPCGEHSGFIQSYIVPYKDLPKPLNAYEIFGLTPPPPRNG
jgi:MoaA/NifB/PqqE/SkfB family radical SAM enzyme